MSNIIDLCAILAKKYPPSVEDMVHRVDLPHWCADVLEHNLDRLHCHHQFRLGLLFVHFEQLEKMLNTTDVLMAIYHVARDCHLSKEQAISLSLFGMPESCYLNNLTGKPNSSILFDHLWHDVETPHGIVCVAEVYVELFRLSTSHCIYDWEFRNL